MSDRQNAFLERVDTYKTILKENIKNRTDDNKFIDTDWLKILYKEHHTRFIHDNNRIWLSGQIMIPLSLAPFIPLANMTNPSIIKLLVLAFASLMMIWIWLLVAETHKAFQQKSLAWIIAIEELLNIHTRELSSRITTDRFQEFLVRKKDMVPWVRRLLALGLSVIWVLILLLWK